MDSNQHRISTIGSTSPRMRAAECSPGRELGVTDPPNTCRAPKGRQTSVARYAGLLSFFAPDARAYARGYILPRLRRSAGGCSAAIFIRHFSLLGWHRSNVIGSILLFLAAQLISSTAAQIQTRQPISTEKHSRYQIKLALDFDNRTYAGTERLRFVNRGEHPTSTLYFHLYANGRVPGCVAPPAPAKAEPGRLTSSDTRPVII